MMWYVALAEAMSLSHTRKKALIGSPAVLVVVRESAEVLNPSRGVPEAAAGNLRKRFE
jgi:hypothetical protein